VDENRIIIKAEERGRRRSPKFCSIWGFAMRDVTFYLESLKEGSRGGDSMIIRWLELCVERRAMIAR